MPKTPIVGAHAVNAVNAATADASHLLASYSIKVRGVVQGVGFRPFVYRLARSKGLKGWVLNAEEGVDILLEGTEDSVQSFLDELSAHHPQAAEISRLSIERPPWSGLEEFAIRESASERRPTVRIAPDLPVCKNCLQELFDPRDRRYHYPYINCTDCGPRYSVIRKLPYDRPNTTMAHWPLDSYCAAEYGDAMNRRFHAQPVACPTCGPHHVFRSANRGELIVADEAGDDAAIREAVRYLQCGKIVAVKGIGGYHLACDAANAAAVSNLRLRKYRKEKPFALMTSNIEIAKSIVDLSPEAEALLQSTARPVVLAQAKIEFAGVAPENDDLGVMLPYTPLHHLLFAAGAPDILVMTSANRSSEPIAYQDEDALQRLAGLADGFLIGQRQIARRVDDSVARVGPFGPAVLRRARGYAPGAVATLPAAQPILALGADLKNAITLVVDGQAFVSQHIGDLNHYESLRAFKETVHDLLAMYEIDSSDLLIVHDAHPQYVSTAYAAELPAPKKCAVQHHRAHIASVLAERGAFDKRVVGLSCDGTGYGDDGAIWGGEFFIGSVREGFERVAHLRPAVLPGGDAAASHPVQAAAGFLAQLDELPDMTSAPFVFPLRYSGALKLLQSNTRCHRTTSIGRLFDTAASLVGFTREISFEGQAAMWLERLASHSPAVEPYPFPFAGGELDFRPLLHRMLEDRLRGRDTREIARAFQRAIAVGLSAAAAHLCSLHETDTVVLSGGVFQNDLLLRDLKDLFGSRHLQVWTNHQVPANDGGISLGQAALAGCATAVAHASREHGDTAWIPDR